MVWHDVVRFVGGTALAAVVVAGCTDPADEGSAESPSPDRSPATSATSPAGTPPESTSPSPTPSPTQEPAVFDPHAAFAVVDRLAGDIGSREATSAAFEQAADFVSGRLGNLGYRVQRVPVPVPAGNSWGVDVDEGTSMNVVADPPGFDAEQPHVVVGAHLDSVPQAPGAEDNASGIGVLLDLARVASLEPPNVPVRFIAFGAEEPRGDGDDMHHFGSQQYVADMSDAQRSALSAMVSLDRVGVEADRIPVCNGGRGVLNVVEALVAAADTIDVPVETCENRASDHWSFEKADVPSARLGSIPFAGYHSPDDVPSVVEPAQLDRVGRVMWAWLRAL